VSYQTVLQLPILHERRLLRPFPAAAAGIFALFNVYLLHCAVALARLSLTGSQLTQNKVLGLSSATL
jgi:hypothetical protein